MWALEWDLECIFEKLMNLWRINTVWILEWVWVALNVSGQEVRAVGPYYVFIFK